MDTDGRKFVYTNPAALGFSPPQQAGPAKNKEIQKLSGACAALARMDVDFAEKAVQAGSEAKLTLVRFFDSHRPRIRGMQAC
jgi:hypothetical protein